MAYDQDAGFSPVGLLPQAPVALPESRERALSAVISEFRDIENMLLSAAQQFPAAAPEVRRAIESVRAVLQRIVATPAGPEPPAPRL